MDSSVLTPVFGIAACLVMVVLFMVFKRHLGKTNSPEQAEKSRAIWILILIFVLLIILDFGKDWFMHLFLSGKPK